MKQVVFISGGETFDTREDCKNWLASDDSNWMLNDPSVEPIKFWSSNLDDDLGDDHTVFKIPMPLTTCAEYDEWKIWFDKHVQFMDNEVTLVCWSLGASFITKYLTENNFPKKIKQLHLVAGHFYESGGFTIQEGAEFQDADEMHIYHSQDDDVVPFENAEQFKRVLPTAALHTFTDRGHFLQESFPELIEQIKTL